MSLEQKPKGNEGVSYMDIGGEEYSSSGVAVAKILRQRGSSCWQNTKDISQSNQGQRSIGSGSGYKSGTALVSF